MKKFFLVWNENGRAPTVKHDHFDAAKAEADRIALKHPGEQVHVLVSVGCSVKREIDWKQHT